jgi:V8-like Glu-specific endopeptidase
MKSDHRSVSSDEPQLESMETPRAVRRGKAIKTIVENVPGYGDAPPDAASGAFGLERVFGTDDRTLVPATSDAPWRWSAALRIRARDGQRFVGTGWFIGPRTLVTAGHCVYMHDHGGFAESIEVIPALDGTKRPFGSVVSRDLKSVEGWTKKRNSDFDYGAIVLDGDVMKDVGAFAYAPAADALLSGANINVSGYPADRDGAMRQYFHARKVIRISSRRVYYHVDTFGGQSGSAAWVTVDRAAATQLGVDVPAGAKEARVVVAIHTAGSLLSNFATRITADVAANLKKWS